MYGDFPWIPPDKLGYGFDGIPRSVFFSCFFAPAEQVPVRTTFLNDLSVICSGLDFACG